MLNTEEINYITLRHDGTISFLPSDKEHRITADGNWSREGRQYGKPGKVIKKLFTSKALTLFKDVDFQRFANSFKSFFCESQCFELLPHNEIPCAYTMERL